MANAVSESQTLNNESMSDHESPLFSGDELLDEGNVNPAPGKITQPANRKTEMSGGKNGAAMPKDNPGDNDNDGDEAMGDETPSVPPDANAPADESGEAPPESNIDESAFQELADQLSSLDDESMMALVRGMPDESRQAMCSAVAGTLSDEQLQQCGLAKGENMSETGDGDGDEMGAGAGDGDGDESDAALQTSMANAKPEQMPGGMNMSLNGAEKITKGATKPHAHSLELAQLKAEKLVSRARAVHEKNPACITADQIEQMEAQLQGAKSLSLLEPDFGDFKAFNILVSMGERMVNSDNDADLLETKTVNMSLTGDETATGGSPRAVKMTAKGNSNGYDEEEAKKLADAEFGKSKGTPSFH